MRVTIYRDHPAEGWLSMDRYAEGLLPALHDAGTTMEVMMPTPPGPWPGRYGQLLRRLFHYPLWARRRQGEINHVLDHSYGHLLLALDPGRSIVNVHDVAPLHYPNRRGGLSDLAWQLAWYGVSRAQHIIVDTPFVAGELSARLRRPSDQFHIVPHAVAPFFRPERSAAVEAIQNRFLAGGERLLLHVGKTERRKNLPTLMRALAILRHTGVPAILLQVGGKPTREQTDLIARLGIADSVHFVGNRSDEELVGYYNAAAVFVFPSLYEGFGLPVLEAMACGTPVICSNAASLPHTAGDAALTVPPQDAGGLAHAIESVLQDENRRAVMIERGLAWTRRFTWKSHAQTIIGIYEAVHATASRTHREERRCT